MSQQNNDSNKNKSPRLQKYFEAMIKADASDLHLKSGSPPHIRTTGDIKPAQSPPLSEQELSELIDELLTEQQKKQYQQIGSVDVAYEVAQSDRFRINIYRQRGRPALAARRVSAQIPDFEALHLPPVIKKISQHQQGLVLVAGPTGCGKSTTLAAMLNNINKSRRCHIATVEDPIEYLYREEQALISQREIGIDVDSYDTALKYLMRSDPDIILIGEMRSADTFQTALHSAETGHMVFSTIHASTAPGAVSRTLDYFPPDSRDVARLSLSTNLVAIICQKLLPSIAKDFDRVPAVEVMLNNAYIRRLIAEGRDGELRDALKAGEKEGMQTFSKSLMDLIQKAYIEPKTAYDVAPNVDELKMMMKGIKADSGGTFGRSS